MIALEKNESGTWRAIHGGETEDQGGREPREYGGPDELAAWVRAMNAQGFSNRDLDMMCKENPAKALGLPVR